MIRLTIWNENYHEKTNDYVRALHPDGIHMTLAKGLADPEFFIRTATLDEPEQGLPDELLNDTDVLIWWGHARHKYVSDELAFRIVQRVNDGMGIIFLHSSHKSKPFKYLLGTQGDLRWREIGEHCNIWTATPSHPIAQGIPEMFRIDHEEMYGEPFGIPTPEDVVFISWFAGGDVFRSGVTFRRGSGKIFYFQPGHETFRSYEHPIVLRVIKNAVFWAKSDTAAPLTTRQIKQPAEELDPAALESHSVHINGPENGFV